MSVKENTSLASLKTHAISRIFRNSEKEKSDTDLMIKRLNQDPQRRSVVGFLSGGNQQKVVLEMASHRPHFTIVR